MKTLKFIFIFLFTVLSNLSFSQTESYQGIEEYDILKIRVKDLEVQSRTQNDAMLKSSNFLIKSANQKNQSIVIGIVGSLISTAFITKDIRNGQTPAFGYALLVGTSVATLSLNISYNNNLKKAGVSLKLK